MGHREPPKYLLKKHSAPEVGAVFYVAETPAEVSELLKNEELQDGCAVYKLEFFVKPKKYPVARFFFGNSASGLRTTAAEISAMLFHQGTIRIVYDDKTMLLGSVQRADGSGKCLNIKAIDPETNEAEIIYVSVE